MKLYFTTQEVASILKVTRMAVRNWIIKGRLTASLTPGGHRRVEREELKRFLKSLGYPVSLLEAVAPEKPNRQLFCWEYFSKGFVKSSHLHNCSDCLISRCRVMYCAALRNEIKSTLIGCQEKCEDCSYFNKYNNPVENDDLPETGQEP